MECHVGDDATALRFALYADASFAGDLRDSKSSSGGLLCLIGPHTFVPLSWLCKKQTAVSHSSTEAEIIALEAAMRMEGLPMLNLWSQVLDTIAPRNDGDRKTTSVQEEVKKYWNLTLESVDYVPASLPLASARTRLIMVEDNDAVIKMLKKGRAPAMAHVARPHRVNLDWLLERSFVDPCVHGRYIDTASQLADILTKPHFTAAAWCNLCQLFRLGFPPSKEVKSDASRPQKEATTTKKPTATSTTTADFVDEYDATKVLKAHSMIGTHELAALRLSQKHLDDILDILKYASVTADLVVKSLLSDKLKEIRSGAKKQWVPDDSLDK